MSELHLNDDRMDWLSVECTAIKDISKWSQFEPIYEKLTKVIEIEKGKMDRIWWHYFEIFIEDLSKTNVSWNREERLKDFTDWLEANGVEIIQFEVSCFPDYGMGLKAKQDLEVQ